MEFRETLLAAQRNQKQKSSDNVYYKARFDPPKKEQKQKEKLSANIQKFLAKKEEEERQKKLEQQRKRDELLAMRDPKAIRKIQKSLKVIKSANKSVIADAIDHEHTAVTREGPSQPDQDDYGYESQEAAAIYQKMMEKYSKMPEEPKFPSSSTKTKKDLDGTRERVKQALQHEDDPVPHKRRRKTEHEVKEPSPPPKSEPEKKKEDKPKFRKPAPPPMDFNQLLKLAEQKKCEPLEAAVKKSPSESEPERLMTKKQKREYEEEMARRMRRQERMEAERRGEKKGLTPTVKTVLPQKRKLLHRQREQIKRKRSNKQLPALQLAQKEEKPPEREGKVEPSGFGRIPKLSDKSSGNTKNDNLKTSVRIDKDKFYSEKEKIDKLRIEKEKLRNERNKLEKVQKERERIRLEKDKLEKDRERIDRERLEKLKAERERIERDIERLNKDRDRLEKTKMKLESVSKTAEKSVDRSKLSNRDQEPKKNIDLKTQNTYRIDKTHDKRNSFPSKPSMNGHSSQGKPMSKDKILLAKQKTLNGEYPKQNGIKNENGKKLSEQNRVLSQKGKPDEKKPLPNSGKADVLSNKPKLENSFDFDKYVGSMKNGPSGGVKKPNGAQEGKRRPHPDDVKRKQMMKRRIVDSDEEHDSEMDDFIDDGEEELDYSKHIKEIFGYDKSRYRDMDDDDDPTMESSFSRQMREEYVSKKIGIMEDLEDMRLEKKMKKKKRRISED